MKKVWVVEIEAADKAVIEGMIKFLEGLLVGDNPAPVPATSVVPVPAAIRKPRAAALAPADRVCVVCGGPLPAGARGKKRICSKRCSNLKFRQKKAEPKPVRTCPVCQKGFQPWRKDQKLCSDCSRTERAPGVPRVDKEARLAAIRAANRRIQIPPEPTDRDYDADDDMSPIDE